MKVVIDRTELLRVLNHVTSLIERRTTIPILSHLRLEVMKGGGLAIVGTDLEREIRDVADATGVPGQTCVPAHMLHDIVRKCPQGMVELVVDPDKGRMSLKAGTSKFQLSTLDAADFPSLSQGKAEHEFRVPTAELRRLVEKTRFAISTEETRYYLNGIFLHAPSGGGEILRAVATDGHRLACIDIMRPAGAEGMPGVIVPRKTVHELARLFEGAPEEIAVQVSASSITFTIGAVRLFSKLIDGTFPDYSRVIPVGNEKVIRIPKAAFMGAVDRVSTVSSERGRAIKIAAAPGHVVLSVRSDGNEASERIDVDTAASIEIGFNSRYLMDIGDQIEGEEASLEVRDPGSPALIRELGDETARYVLMPMRA